MSFPVNVPTTETCEFAPGGFSLTDCDMKKRRRKIVPYGGSNPNYYDDQDKVPVVRNRPKQVQPSTSPDAD